MSYLKLTTAVLLGMTVIPAVAQVPPPGPPSTGARPGQVPDIVEQAPHSNAAGTLRGGASQAVTAPTPSDPALGGEMRAYLQAARTAMVAGRTARAQESLEMAETRMLDRAVPEGQTNIPLETKAVAGIRDARLALRGGDRATAIDLVDTILAR